MFQRKRNRDKRKAKQTKKTRDSVFVRARNMPNAVQETNQKTRYPHRFFCFEIFLFFMITESHLPKVQVMVE